MSHRPHQRALPARPALVALVVLAACAADPPPDPSAPAPAPIAITAPRRSACEALARPLRALRRQASMVSLGRSMPVVPAHPAEYVARLDELAAEARAVTSDDAALAKIAADAAARIEAIAAAARAFAAREGEASRKVLLDAMERGELVVAEGEHRCVEGGGASQGRLSAAALESGSGRLPASLLRRALGAGAPAWRRCVEAGLARDPGLVGAVRVRFVVERDGRVSEAVDADRAPPDPEAWASSVKAPPVRDVIVSDCVVAALKLLAFPRPQGGSFSATYTLEVGSR